MTLKRHLRAALGLTVRLRRSTSRTSTTRSTTPARSRRPPERELARRDGRRRTSTTPAASGLGRPDREPRATETVPEIVALIERLVERGLAYAGATATSTSASRAFDEYGELSGQRTDELLEEGARRAGRGQGVAARLRALEGAQAGRGHAGGPARGATGARAGTSSARPWPCASSARSSTCTAAGST